MGIYISNVIQTVDCIIFRRNPDMERVIFKLTPVSQITQLRETSNIDVREIIFHISM